MLTDRVIAKAIYIGSLHIREDNFIDFVTPHMKKSRYDRKYFIGLGDIVYFMFVDGVLMKIGKAGKAKGWYSRVSLYRRGSNKGGDKTNRLIIDEMNKMDKKNIEVFAIPCPRKKELHMDILSDEAYEIECETAGSVESYYTDMYLNEKKGNTLRFCKQLK